MKKTLFTLVSDKALSLMGDLRIETFNYPGNPAGKITGISSSFKELIVDLDGVGETRLPVDNYLQNYRYSQYPQGIRTELSRAGREQKESSYMDAAELLGLGDVTKDDHDFAIASKKAPKYVAWEMIKSAESVTALHKTDEDGDRYFIKATTPRGEFTATVPVHFLDSVPDGVSLYRLPTSPVAAIAIAKAEIPDFIKTHHYHFGVVDRETLTYEDMRDFYLIGAVHKNLVGTDCNERKYLDYRGNWVDTMNLAATTQETFNLKTGQRNNPVEIWSDFLTDYMPENYVLTIMPANGFAPAQQEDDQLAMR